VIVLPSSLCLILLAGKLKGEKGGGKNSIGGGKGGGESILDDQCFFFLFSNSRQETRVPMREDCWKEERERRERTAFVGAHSFLSLVYFVPASLNAVLRRRRRGENPERRRGNGLYSLVSDPWKRKRSGRGGGRKGERRRAISLTSVSLRPAASGVMRGSIGEKRKEKGTREGGGKGGDAPMK